MKKVFILAVFAVMLGAMGMEVDAKELTTTGSMVSYDDSYGTTRLYWSNTEGTCQFIASKKTPVTSVAVSFNGSTWASKSAENLVVGKKVKATKDVGYKSTKLYGRVTH